MRHGKLSIYALAVVLMFGIVLMAGSFVFAQDKPCAGDVEKFCQGVEKGEGRIAKCLKQHEKELSPQCQARLKEAAAQFKEVKEVCRDDVLSLCGGVQPGQGRVAACLKEHADEVSPGCKAKLGEMKEKKAKKQQQQKQ